VEIGLSGKGFGHLLLLLGVVSLIVIFATFTMARRRGIDTTTHRFILMVAVSCLVLFGIVPLWFTDISTKWKLIGTILALAVAILNYFGTDRLQKKLSPASDKEKSERGEKIEP
jgi:Ca2+/Na+ antiporter